MVTDAEAAYKLVRDLPTGAKMLLGAHRRALVDAFARHREQSTAALSAEVERLREALGVWLAYDAGYWADRETEMLDAYDAAIEATRAALSTTSEVSEPVADESGGDAVREALGKRIDNVIHGNARDQSVIGDVIGLLQEIRATLAKHGGEEA